LSPRLAFLCRDHVEIHDALARVGLLSCNDLGALNMDSEAIASRLGLDEDMREPFDKVLVAAKVRYDGAHSEKMTASFDVLNGEGNIIMRKPRGHVHRNGFWHRAVNVWVVSARTSTVLVGRRAPSKEVDAGRWTCVCGRVPSGELSMNAAVARLDSELSIKLQPDAELAMAFTMRCSKAINGGIFAGWRDNVFIDVYVARIEEEIPIARLLVDRQAKEAIKWISLAELQSAFESRDQNYVIPPTEDYCKKLIFYLNAKCHALEWKPWRGGPNVHLR